MSTSCQVSVPQLFCFFADRSASFVAIFRTAEAGTQSQSSSPLKAQQLTAFFDARDDCSQQEIHELLGNLKQSKKAPQKALSGHRHSSDPVVHSEDRLPRQQNFTGELQTKSHESSNSAHINRLYTTAFKKQEMIEKLAKRVQRDRGITFKPKLTPYRPPGHILQLREKKQTGTASQGSLLAVQDPLSQPYYPSLNTIDYFRYEPAPKPMRQ